MGLRMVAQPRFGVKISSDHARSFHLTVQDVTGVMSILELLHWFAEASMVMLMKFSEGCRNTCFLSWFRLNEFLFWLRPPPPPSQCLKWASTKWLRSPAVGALQAGSPQKHPRVTSRLRGTVRGFRESRGVEESGRGNVQWHAGGSRVGIAARKGPGGAKYP